MAENSSSDFVQPDHFAFDAESEAAIPPILAKYPAGKQASGVLPLLYLVQNQMKRQTGSAWVPTAGMNEVARRLDIDRAPGRNEIDRDTPAQFLK